MMSPALHPASVSFFDTLSLKLAASALSEGILSDVSWHAFSELGGIDAVVFG